MSWLAPRVRARLREGRAAALDALDALRPHRDGDELLPPRRLRLRFGGGDFRSVGADRVRSAVELAGLDPGSRVLDVGCGTGRLALALTRLLDGGSYEGFDPDPAGVEWCRARITPRFPRFRFRRLDVRNRAYNPRGREAAETLRFPYPDGEFDVVILSSIFTHLPPAAVANYLREVARVLCGGGRCFATFFLIEEGSLRRIESGSADLDLRPVAEDGRVFGLRGSPLEAATGLREDDVRSMHAAAGLRIRDPITFGSWSGLDPASCRDYQDIVVSSRA